MADTQKDMDRYLARIRKTIEESKNLVAQAELRIAETDRLLEKQGLSREQVMAMRFSQTQIDAVNEELKRRGMDPLEEWSKADEPDAPDVSHVSRPDPVEQASSDELAYRQSKFGMMMKPFHI